MFDKVLPHPILYKRGTKGEVRTWRMELGTDPQDPAGLDAAHRVVSGIDGGALTRSGWSVAECKNVGRKNATTSYEQAVSEIANTYTIKLATGYFESLQDIDKVAFTKPMLATDWAKRAAKVAVTEGVYAQPKLDGIRCIARADGLWTRTGKKIVSMPHIEEALALRFEDDPDLELDGELYNHILKDDFNTITSIVRKAKPKPEDVAKARDLVEYHIYDMPSHAGVFSERSAAIVELLKLTANHACLKAVPTELVHSTERLDELDAEWMGDGYEGQMVRLDEVYQNKRSNFLMKRKVFETAEFPVLRVEEGNGNWAGCVKRFIVALPDGSEGEATPRGTQERMRDLLENQPCPDWATVRYFGFTPAGKPRFPIAIDYGYGERAD